MRHKKIHSYVQNNLVASIEIPQKRRNVILRDNFKTVSVITPISSFPSFRTNYIMCRIDISVH